MSLRHPSVYVAKLSGVLRDKSLIKQLSMEMGHDLQHLPSQLTIMAVCRVMNKRRAQVCGVSTSKNLQSHNAEFNWKYMSQYISGVSGRTPLSVESVEYTVAFIRRHSSCTYQCFTTPALLLKDTHASQPCREESMGQSVTERPCLLCAIGGSLPH